MSQYIAAVPADGSAEPAIQKFFENFYRISDTADAHESYADQFTKEGTLIMIADTINGHDAIVKKRHAMWERVATRSHKPTKIFTFGSGSKDVMLYGTVDYALKDGKKASDVEWAARAHLVESEAGLKMDFYQVFLVGILRGMKCLADYASQDSASMIAKAK